MSFGFSIGDIVTLSTFAYKVYDSCKTSSGEFRSLASEINSLHLVLEETAKSLGERSLGGDGGKKLQHIKGECELLLTEIELLLKKYGSLGTKKRRIMHKIGWALNDIHSIRSRLISNVGILTALNTNLMNYSQARVEKGVTELLSRPTFHSCQSADASETQTPSNSMTTDIATSSMHRNHSMPITCKERTEWQSPELLEAPSDYSAPLQDGHAYGYIGAQDHALQINGDIGAADANLHRRHTYNFAMVSGNARQINGNMLDASFFREFLRT